MIQIKHASSFGLAMLCAFLASVWTTSCRRETTSVAPRYYWSDSLRPRRIMVVGDLQPTLWVERTFLGRKQNDTVRRRVIEAVQRENPEMLLLLGDLVADGARASDWTRFDSLMEPISGIPLYAVIGNHDYGAFSTNGLPHFKERFPYCLTLPRVVRLADSVMLIVLDSNVELLPEAVREAQAERYRALLLRMDLDPSVRGVIVADHHPPYSNSDLHIDERVRGEFAVPFQEGRKTCLFLSGHVHSYERFSIDGKVFVVSGGGGGPRREVDTSATRRYMTDRWRHGSRRPHNYLRIEIDPTGLHAETMMLVGDGFRVGDRWTVDFSK